MKILIIEDELLVADYIRQILIRNGHAVLGIADTLADVEQKLIGQPDACLLDIRLSDGENGIRIGALLKDKGIPFIYLTANNEMSTIQQAITTQPETYLSKPFNERDIIAALALIEMKQKASSSIQLRGSQGHFNLLLSEILFLKADNVYTEVHTRDKVFIERQTLKEMEEQLGNSFKRVHRSFIVNTDHIQSRKRNSIFINGFEIPVSRNY